MGKGGEATAQRVHIEDKGQWISPYNPLDPKAPELPSKGEIKAVIPKECFERSYLHSMYFVARDTALAVGCAYIAYQTLSTDMPSNLLSTEAVSWFIGWNVYAFWMGCILTGHWVLAHECGHGAFSKDKKLQDAVGYVLHSLFLVPYYSWQRSHAVHHRYTNHMELGETHVPDDENADDNLYDSIELRKTFLDKFGDEKGIELWGSFQAFLHLIIGWPAYLLIGATGGPDRGMTNHYFPNPLTEPKQPKKELFPGNWKEKVYQSDIGVAFVAAGALTWAACNGIPEMMAMYGGPLIVVNAWLVLYTW